MFEVMRCPTDHLTTEGTPPAPEVVEPTDKTEVAATDADAEAPAAAGADGGAAPPKPKAPSLKIEPTLYKNGTHRFSISSTDWGFHECFKLGDLIAKLGADEHLINFMCEIEDVVPDPPYNSKKSTGLVGLKNQGATCYMNSLLQVRQGWDWGYGLGRVGSGWVGSGWVGLGFF